MPAYDAAHAAIDTTVAGRTRPKPGVADPPRARLLAGWLLSVAGMVAAMVVLGGLTRLTESGLSMVEWRPVTGWLPPLTHEAWEAAFRAYQQFPEYQKVNRGMSLAEFQDIYWLEYLHRLWGRLIGVAFAVPFVFFLIRGWIDRRLGWELAGMFVLGGLQGALGWYMVASGLVDRPDVSQYRLAAHLGLALVIYGYLLWVALRLLAAARAAAAPAGAAAAAPAGAGPVSIGVVRRAGAVAVLVFVTMLSGAFVAGLDAGHAYNTFPLMDGELLPPGLFTTVPAWVAPFEDVTTTQFVHRLLAIATLLAIVVFRLTLPAANLAPGTRRLASAWALWALVQVSLGVATLLTFVMLPVAALHQASALVLWTLALCTVRALDSDRLATSATSPAGLGAGSGARSDAGSGAGLGAGLRGGVARRG